MAVRLNKKVLCFIDEYGTAGTAPFHLGAVFVLASEAGRLDKGFSDLLEANANEIHAVNLTDAYLQGLLGRCVLDHTSTEWSWSTRSFRSGRRSAGSLRSGGSGDSEDRP